MDFLDNKLRQRQNEGTLRELRPFLDGMDFYSNDYLGMATNETLHAQKNKLLLDNELFFRNGAGGSRLISGNFSFYEETEAFLASFYGAESALVFQSGYAALLGTLSCLPSRSDTVLYDELVHASARDGIRLSAARNFSFRHNDINDLEAKLKRSKGTVFVVMESVYSMDGDMSPLPEIKQLQLKYGFVLLVDEAHSGGIYGVQGKGLAYELADNKHVIRIVTFGKAYGAEGACVLGTHTLRNYLVNFSRPFIYTTAPSPDFFAKIRTSVETVSAAHEQREQLTDNIQTFRTVFGEYFPCYASPIQIYKPGSKSDLRKITQRVLDAGFMVRPIYSPTVKEGEERLRIILHSYNNEYQIEQLSEVLLDR